MSHTYIKYAVEASRCLFEVSQSVRQIYSLANYQLRETQVNSSEVFDEFRKLLNINRNSVP